MRTVIVGDVHGCLTELVELIELVDLKKADRLIPLGDVLDKGPDSAGVVKYLRKLRETGFRVEPLMGNHEQNFLRWVKIVGTLNTPTEKYPWASKLTAPDVQFLLSSKPFLRLEEHNALCVHAGVMPDWVDAPWTWDAATLDHNLNRLLRVRYVTSVMRTRVTLEFEVEGEDPVVQALFEEDRVSVALGEFLATRSTTRTVRKHSERPKGSFIKLGEETDQDAYWADVYDGRFGMIYFGHHPFLPTGKAWPVFPFARGVDGGCVFGGDLHAAVLEAGKVPEYVSVKAKKAYATSLWSE